MNFPCNSFNFQMEIVSCPTYPSLSSISLHSRCQRQHLPIISFKRDHKVSVSNFNFTRSSFTSFQHSSGYNMMRRHAGFRFSPIKAAFTERAVKAVILSQKEAKAFGMSIVFTQHVLLGLIAEDKDPHGFLGSGITLESARNAVYGIWKNYNCDQKDDDGYGIYASSCGNAECSTGYVPLSRSTKMVLESAFEYSRNMGHEFISPEHIFLGLFTVDDGNAVKVLQRLEADINELVAMAISRLQTVLIKNGPPRWIRKSIVHAKAAVGRSFEKTREKRALDTFCVDLTARANKGLVDPVIGRENEIQRIIQILCRRTKNNPILLGASGVGKTAIAEGLALRLAEEDVPIFLSGKRIMSLDIGLLIAGTKERGELEARVTKLISEIKKSGRYFIGVIEGYNPLRDRRPLYILSAGNIILFIDEAHTLVGRSNKAGQGTKRSGIDIADLLKPSLGRGELQCIASTTIDEYRMYFENDKALARRFQPVMINEPSQEDSVRILLGLREKYEAHHNCRFTLEAINAAVYLSARYISDRYLPDKAIDLMDEAGSVARIKAFKTRRTQNLSILSRSPDELWQEIRTVDAMHEVVLASKSKHNVYVYPIRGRNRQNSKLLMSSTSEDSDPVEVTPNDIELVASQWTEIPLQQLTADEEMLLLSLDKKLSKHVVGQEEAITAISRPIKRSRLGLKNPKRPIATLLFCGPSGVGKTELVKALATCYFGSEAAMIRLDMSEYMERDAVAKLIGSPPGYTGYREGGTLTEAVRRRPFSVVLIDSIEKAHPDIVNIFLQLLEEGHISDSQGRRVTFKNSLIIMTSNIGSTVVLKAQHAFSGFFSADYRYDPFGMKAFVMEDLKAYFPPEFINRIDEVVIFQPLKRFQILQVLDLILQQVKEKLVSWNIDLEVSESVKEFICQQRYSESYGVPSLKRAVTSLIEDPLSEALLAGYYMPGDIAVIDLDASGIPVINKRS